MIIKTSWLYSVLAFLVLAGCSDSGLTGPEDEADSNMDSNSTFDPHVVVSPFPAITDAPMIPASAVTDQVLEKNWCWVW